jgi:hypothetical protein
MEQAVAESLIHGPRGQFDLATPDDEAQLRRLARDNAMGGAIKLALEPTPNSPLPQIAGPIVYQTVVGRRSDGTLFGAGTRSVSMAFVNGEPMPLGYLSGMRLDTDYRAKPRTILSGYEFLRELHESDGATEIYLTSIMSDNLVARRLLEANLRGMPTYRFVGEFATLIFRRQRNGEFTKPSSCARADLRRKALRLNHDAADADALAAVFNRSSRSFQFARLWSARDMNHLKMRVASHATGVAAASAMWHSQIPKRVVVRGYTRAFAFARPMLNMLAPVTKLPKFPKVGQPLRSAYLSLAGIPPERVDTLVPLVRALHASAHSAHVDCFIAGAAAGDPRLEVLGRSFGGRVIRSRLYVVFWPDGREAADALDHRLCHPEVALL